jgi:hypothetical protein
MPNFSVWFTPDQMKAIDRAAEERGFSRNALIRKAVNDALENVDQTAISRRLQAIEKTNKTLFAWIDTLTKALYVRLPTPPKELRETAKQEGTRLYEQHVQRVAQVIGGAANGEKTGG